MEKILIIRKIVNIFLAGGISFLVLFSILGFFLYYADLTTDDYAIQYGGIGAVILTWPLLYLHLRKSNLSIWLFPAGVLGSIITPILLIWILIQFNRNPHDNSGYRDGRKILSVKQIQLALEIYADNNELLYPPMPSVCTNIELLKNYLEPKFISSGDIMSEQIKLLVPDYKNNFQIAISPDRKSYVMRVLLEDADKKNIREHLNGKIMECDCDGNNYCVGGEIK